MPTELLYPDEYEITMPGKGSKPVTLQGRGERGAVQVSPPLSKTTTMLRSVALLVNTSKMGCHSFNLPAGPLSFNGTCPSSVFGFPMVPDRSRNIKRSSCFARTKVDEETWLCAGCYGLKGLYGSPLMLAMMEVRRRWVEATLRDGTFVDVMVKAIRMGQIDSLRLRSMIRRKQRAVVRGKDIEAWQIPDPKYFRIHDVGDFYNAKYLRAWMEVCARLSEPGRDGRTRLPAVRFWAPTRVWMLPGYDRIVRDKPDNLVIRPSAPSFGSKSPRCAGWTEGATSACISPYVTSTDVKTVERVTRGGWLCPAYLDASKGGGTKEVEGKLVGGACALSIGPDGEKRAPGPGCRACWDRPDLAVVYPEH